MKFGKETLRIIFMAMILMFSNSVSAQTKGHIVAMGGGKRPQSVLKKIVELGGGSNAVVGIIPIGSSEYRKAGKSLKKEFEDAGVDKIFIFNGIRPEHVDKLENIQKMKTCTVFFFGGGDQRKLTAVYNNTKALDLIRQKYQEGAVVAGTSAGTAVMSGIMITGDGKWNVIQKGSVKVSSGFGFVKSLIIDQHFVARSRMNRLISVCLTENLDGIGIDEATALWIDGNGNATVIGDYSVIRLQRGEESLHINGEDQNMGVRNLILSVLLPGDSFHIEL